MARGRRDRALEQQWRERVAGWTGSGQSVRAFCRQHGLIETSFFYWKVVSVRRRTVGESLPSRLDVVIGRVELAGAWRVDRRG